MSILKKTIVDVKREQDIPYKKSGVQHFVNDDFHGTSRLNLDSRPVAGSDALFGSYDYFGGSHEPGKSNPSIGPYWRMDQFDSMDEFLSDVRKERQGLVHKKDETNKGVNQILTYASVFLDTVRG